MNEITLQDRNLAVKICFAHNFNSNSIEDILEHLKVTELDEHLHLKDESKKIIDYAITEKDALDKTISEYLIKLGHHRISVIDKLILRLAISELILNNDINSIETIENYIDISNEFCSDNSVELINGILDALYNNEKFKSEINTK